MHRKKQGAAFLTEERGKHCTITKKPPAGNSYPGELSSRGKSQNQANTHTSQKAVCHPSLTTGQEYQQQEDQETKLPCGKWPGHIQEIQRATGRSWQLVRAFSRAWASAVTGQPWAIGQQAVFADHLQWLLFSLQLWISVLLYFRKKSHRQNSPSSTWAFVHWLCPSPPELVQNAVQSPRSEHSPGAQWAVPCPWPKLFIWPLKTMGK